MLVMSAQSKAQATPPAGSDLLNLPSASYEQRLSMMVCSVCIQRMLTKKEHHDWPESLHA
jgi:hypothetical protein